MIDLKHAVQISKYRNECLNIDTSNLQEKRKRFLDWLLSFYPSTSKTKKPETTLKLDFYVYEGGFETLEMYDLGDEVKKTKPQRYISFNPKHNTRTKINSETCLETDKLEFDKAITLMCETLLSLIRHKIHFAVFYAEGQRSPHIRIYDFFELEELNPKQRIKAQIEFWRQHVPFGCFHYFDNGMFVDEHPLQIEFAPHWKYHTPFDLLFEWMPENEQT